MKDKTYGVKVNGKRLKIANQYCKDNDLSLPNKVRQLITKYYKLSKQEE